MLQDEGNELVVNVDKTIDTIETSPGMYGVLPAIYVPFYVPEKKDFNKFFWGIIIQNVTQSIQYSASMAMRSLRGLEKGANVAHPVFQHIISKSEKDMASFVVHVQGRWLTGHIHVIRPELQGGRVALDVNFEPLEIDKKRRADGTPYTTVQEYVDDLINRGEEMPEIDKNAILEGADADSLDIRVSGVDDQTANHLRDTLKRVFPITSGYYRSILLIQTHIMVLAKMKVCMAKCLKASQSITKILLGWEHINLPQVCCMLVDIILVH